MTDRPRLERVLGVLRLSQQADGSTSIERQQEGIDHWAASPLRNARVVAWADDPGVSGGLSPFKRPVLGSWLTDERADKWDTLAFLKIDRLSRRVAHFSEVLHWAQEHGKSVVSVSEGIDMSTPMGKMFAQILAVFAEGELDTIKLRIEDAKNRRLDKGWWIAGLPSFGYTLERLGENKGKWLVQHPEYAELARGFAQAVMNGRSLRSMAKKLNEQGVMTWQDTVSVMAGKPARGTRWTADSIREVLKNPRIAGLFTYKGEVMEDMNGEPVMVTAQPILDRPMWYSVVEKLEKNQGPVRTTKRAFDVGELTFMP
ncbi:recombinase family protein [Streptomyces sp. NPDC000880]